MIDQKRENPLLREWDYPPLAEVRDEDFEPAMLAAIKENEEEIARIVNTHTRPTFDNTIAPLDGCGAMLDRVESVFFNMLSAASTPRREELAAKFAPMLSRHHNSVMHNKSLYERVRFVWRSKPQRLTPEQQTLLDATYRSFVRSGAQLDKKGKARMSEISEKLSKLTVDFSSNLLHARKEFSFNVSNPKSVEGVPQAALSIAAEKARAAGHEGWDVTLDGPVYGPVMIYSPDRELRRSLYMARNSACLQDSHYSNLHICRDIVNLRLEKAKLLGYESYADYVLERRMAENKKNVYDLLHKLTAAYMPQARREVEAVTEFARKEQGADFQLMPWDFAYYSQKLRLSLFDIDGEMLRPYFELSRVREGVFSLAGELYGVAFHRNVDAPIYASDVEAYDCIDAGGAKLGTLYLDLFPRDGKQGGAWTTNYSPEYRDEQGRRVWPVVAIVTNFTRPAEGRPSLLTFGEVNTLLHEFGHSLHALFANTTYRSLSGTSVYWDFVELPSQFMENFAMEKKFLTKFARHYATGAPLPDELLEKLKRSRNYNVAYATIRQVSLGLLDMALYGATSPINNVSEEERKATEGMSLLPHIEGTGMAVHFSHIMDGGYAAGYYSYKWAEVLDADAFQAFREQGTFSREMAARFRSSILEKGGTEPPMLLYERFRGKKPTIEAMMERDGILNNKETK